MKTIHSARIAFMCIVLTAMVAGCKKDTTPQNKSYTIPSNLQLITGGYPAGSGVKAEVYAASALYVGYNKIYIALYDSVTNNRLTQANITLAPSVTVNNATLTMPAESPSAQVDANGFFEGAVVATQASGNYDLNLFVHGLASGKTGGLTATAAVVALNPPLAFSDSAAPNTNLFVSLVQPTMPGLGVNTFELAIYKWTANGMIMPDSSLNIQLSAQMPGMSGMNSPNNVNPVYTGNGHYQGKVDFIMTGGWLIDLNLLNNGAVVDSSHYFSLNILN